MDLVGAMGVWQSLFSVIGLIFLLPLSAALFWVARRVPLAAPASGVEGKVSLRFLWVTRGSSCWR